jgi:hypothetical protein
MQDNTRRVMIEAIDQFATSLAYGYTDSTHDAFDLIVDRLRHAYVCEEAEMNGEEPPTFNDFFRETYGHDFSPANPDELDWR